MARVTNESLQSEIDSLRLEVKQVFNKLPNGQLAVLQTKLEDIQNDVSKLIEKYENFTKNVYNPDDGVVTRVNKNSDYIGLLKEEKAIDTIRTVDRFRSNYSKLMWGLYALLLGTIFKEQILRWLGT